MADCCLTGSFAFRIPLFSLPHDLRDLGDAIPAVGLKDRERSTLASTGVCAGAALCFRPGERPHLLYRLRLWHGRKGERRGFTWT
jgi:hypothetical protein